MSYERKKRVDNNCRFYIVSLDNYNSKDDPADNSWIEELFVLEEYRGTKHPRVFNGRR